MSESSGVTAPQPRKWCEERIAFAQGRQVEERFIRFIGNDPSAWALCVGDHEPLWNDPAREFRLHDPYRHLRDAIRAGEKIELHVYKDVWVDIENETANNPNRDFPLPVKDYRIAKKAPKPDYVVDCDIRLTYGRILKGSATICGETNEPISIEVCK